MIKKRDLEKAKQGNMEAIKNLCDAYWADIEETGSGKILEALKEGLKKAMDRLAGGEALGYIINSALTSPRFKKDLKDLMPEYKKAYHKWVIVDTKNLIQRFEKNGINIEEYQQNKYWWLRRIDKHVPKKLKGQFYLVFNAFRTAHGIDRIERMINLINTHFGSHSFFEKETGIKIICGDGHRSVLFNKKTGKINFSIGVDWPDLPNEPGFGNKILKKFKENYGLKASVNYHSAYTPEDMDKPLEEAYWTLDVITYEKKLSATIDFVRQMLAQIKKT